MEREYKCGVDYNINGINFNTAMDPPQITKSLQCVFFFTGVRVSE
jgi:hypothetical protein